VGPGIGRPEELPAFGSTPSSQSVPTQESDAPGPPRSPDEPPRPARRDPPAPVGLEAAPVPKAAPPQTAAQPVASPGIVQRPRPAPPAAGPLAQQPTLLRDRFEEEQTRLKPSRAAAEAEAQGSAPLQANEAADHPEERPERSSRWPLMIVAAALAGIGLAVLVGVLGLKLFAEPQPKEPPELAIPNLPSPIPPEDPTKGSPRLLIRVLPYGTVKIDERELGMSPFDAPIVVTEGEHVVTARNPDNGQSEVRTVTVGAAEEVSLNFDLR
jgi:hypothetical protein